MNIHSNIQGQIDGEQEDKGFTLIEILIAIVLVGILSAVAVVGISSLVSKGSASRLRRFSRCGEGWFGRVLRGEFHLPGHVDPAGQRHLPDAAQRRHRQRSGRGCDSAAPSGSGRHADGRVCQLEADDAVGRNLDHSTDLRLHLS